MKSMSIKIILLFLLSFILMYIVLWLFSLRTFKVTYGMSFNQNRAESLGLDWKQTYEAMLSDLRPRAVRIAAMWNEVEPWQGEYQYDNVDWMMDKAAQYGTRVTLVVGQKAPRWPECHVPEWVVVASTESNDQLMAYVRRVVERYQKHPALSMWQVENEPFIHFQFGECAGYKKELVLGEIALVRSIDTKHPILVTDSGELGLWRKTGRTGDLLGTTMYRIVQTPRGNIISYSWLPPAFYTFKAWITGIDMSRLIVAELQAEPWFTASSPLQTPISEQEKTMDPTRLTKHLDYVTHVGTDTAFLWGVEWWYFMKQKNGDSRYWDIVRDTIAQSK